MFIVVRISLRPSEYLLPWTIQTPPMPGLLLLFTTIFFFASGFPVPFMMLFSLRNKISQRQASFPLGKNINCEALGLGLVSMSNINLGRRFLPSVGTPGVEMRLHLQEGLQHKFIINERF